MKENFYKLHLQMFADPQGGTDGNDPQTGGNDPQEEMIPKKLFDKQATEISNLKKQLKDKLSDEEAAAEAQKEKDKELEELRSYKQKALLASGLSEYGIDSKNSQLIADAVISGDMDKVSKIVGGLFKQTNDNHTKEIEALKLGSIERPQGSAEDKEVTLESYKKMSVDERVKLKNSNPELYKTLSDQAKQFK